MIQWKDEQYNCYSTKLDNGFIKISIGWSSDGYKVHVGDFVLKQRFSELDVAKKAAENFAKIHLINAVKELTPDIFKDGE